MLIVVENVYPSSIPSKFHMIDPADGTILGTVNFPFNGYCMGISYDGLNLWVVQWSPINVIYEIGLDGSLISQFTPATGAYSCRSLNVEGDNLWVGANAGSNDTKLYKMTMTGAIQEEYITGSVVGWYMGGEIDTQYPTGFNLFVVDNIGNTIKQLSTAGGSVSLMAQFASPVAPGDYAEGLTFDGEYLWHNAGYASQGLIWCIDDGMAGTLPDVTVFLDPTSSTIIPAGGGMLEFVIGATNNEPGMATCDIWTDATLPDGSIFGPIIGPVNKTFNAGQTASRDRTQNIPGSAPTGLYTYNAYAGFYPSQIASEAHFDFEKLADGDGGAYIGDWSTSGDLFEGETPEKFALLGNYPNPFNPTTTIEFSLAQADFVDLSVFDITGRHVTTLVDGFRDTGTHEVTFDAAGMTTGLYVYRLTSGAQSVTGKMILMK
jgi:hypothetical protein